MRILVFILAMSSISFCAGQAKATVFFDDSFESTLTSSGWTTGSCNPTGTQLPDGCNPTRSTDLVNTGSYSLKGTYHTSCSQVTAGQFGCGAWIDRIHHGVDEVYTRFYYRTVGFSYESVTGGTKHFYQQNGSGLYPNFYWINLFGSREFSAVVQVEADSLPPCNGAYNTCNFHANVSHIPLNDNQWYCIETHIKMNTPGVANGVIEAWVNGTQTLNYTGRTFRGSAVSGTNGNSSLSNITVTRIYVQDGDGLMYYDNFAVGDTRIGCSGSPPPSATDITPPASPVGLTIH